MPAPIKSSAVALLSPTLVTHNSRQVGSTLDVAAVHLIGVSMWLARANGTAHASPWAQIVIEGCPHATDDSLFFPLRAPLLMPAGANIASTTTNGAVTATATSFSVASATNIAAGARLFVGDPTASNWEIVRVQSISGTTLTIDGAFRYSHTSGQVVTSQAEVVTIPALDVSGILRLRCACLNQSGQSVYAAAVGVTTVL